MLSNMEREHPQVNLKLSEEVVGGEYVNLAIIAHSSSEFVFDFAIVLPGIEQPEVSSRLIMAPEHAKRLLLALRDNIEKYESQFGKIRLLAGGEGLPPAMGPGIPTAQA